MEYVFATPKSHCDRLSTTEKSEFIARVQRRKKTTICNILKLSEVALNLHIFHIFISNMVL